MREQLTGGPEDIPKLNALFDAMNPEESMPNATDNLIDEILGPIETLCDDTDDDALATVLPDAFRDALRKLFEPDGDALEPIEEWVRSENAGSCGHAAGETVPANCSGCSWAEALAESETRIAVIGAKHSEKLQVMLDQFHRQDRECALMEAEKTDLRAELKGLEIKAKNLCCAYGNLLMDFKELIRRKEFVAGVTQHMGQHEPAITVEEIEVILKKHEEIPDATETKVEKADPLSQK